MKNIIFKKVIPIISVVVIIVSLFCFNTSAITLDEFPKNLTWVNLKPGSAFALFHTNNDVIVTKSDSIPDAILEENDLIYKYEFKAAWPGQWIDNIFFNINVKEPYYELKPNVNYYFKFKVIVPTAYAPGGSSGYGWGFGNFSAGAYSWASVGYNDRLLYNIPFSSPLTDIWNNDIDNFAFKPYPYLINGSAVQLSYFDVYGTVTRNSSMTLKSIGFQLPINLAAGWHGWLGVGGFQIGLPSEYAPLPGGTPNYDSGNTNNMHDLENNINNQNQANINAGNQLFNNFGNLLTSDSRLVKGITASTFIFNRLFGNIPWVNNLLTFSLTLGLVAFLLGSGVAIYNAGHNKNVRSQRRAENEKRQAQMRAARAARAKKSKGG